MTTDGKEDGARLPEPRPTIAEALDALDLLGGPTDEQEPPGGAGALPYPANPVGISIKKG